MLQRKKERERSNTEKMRRRHGGLAGQLHVLKKPKPASINSARPDGSVMAFSSLSLFVPLL